MPIIDVSGIEKSSFRQTLDKKSDNIRSKLVSTFTKKSKEHSEPSSKPQQNVQRPPILSQDLTDDVYNGIYELPVEPDSPPPRTRRPRNESDPMAAHLRAENGRSRIGDTSIPVKRWLGGGRPPTPWNRLKKVRQETRFPLLRFLVMIKFLGIP
jgi:hypothetical protein